MTGDPSASPDWWVTTGGTILTGWRGRMRDGDEPQMQAVYRADPVSQLPTAVAPDTAAQILAELKELRWEVAGLREAVGAIKGNRVHRMTQTGPPSEDDKAAFLADVADIPPSRDAHDETQRAATARATLLEKAGPETGADL